MYDPDCRIHARHMVLDQQQVGAIGACRNEGCLVALVAFGAVSAATAVVSGSIVVVGNVAYWFEKRSNCRPVDAPPVAPGPPAAAAAEAPAHAQPTTPPSPLDGERVPTVPTAGGSNPAR